MTPMKIDYSNSKIILSSAFQKKAFTVGTQEYNALQAVRQNHPGFALVVRQFKTNTKQERYNVGDIVYIYCTRPFMRVMYKAVVEKESMASNEIVDDSNYWFIQEEHEKALSGKYARLRLIAQADTERLSLDELKRHGLKAAPQGPLRVSAELANYIDCNMDEFRDDGIFPDSSDVYEGAKTQILVNKYERSSIARQRCIAENGTTCFVCGLNFEDFYGEIGKGFIHVHHIVPLHEIGETYKVDYKKDLIPVCPNCHAMLHRKKDGQPFTWQELKNIVDTIREHR